MLIPKGAGRVPFLFFASALCLGIIMFYRAWVPAWCAALFLLCGGGMSLVYPWLARRKGPQVSWVSYAGPMLCMAGLGILAAWRVAPFPIEQVPAGYIARGRVEEVRPASHGICLTVKMQGLIPRRSGNAFPMHGRVLLYTDSMQLAAGTLISFPASFDTIDEDNGYLFSRGIDFRAHQLPEHIAITGYADDLFSRASGMQQALSSRLEHSRLPSPTAHFLQALLLGDKRELGTQTREIFAGAGIAHVLAVSGLHVGILAMLLGGLLYPLRLCCSRGIRMCIIAAGIWIFALITGLAAPVVRAAVMFTAVGMAVALERRSQSVNSLAIALMLILLIEPRAYCDAGLLLSFVVTAEILLLAEPLTPLSSWRNPRLHSLGLMVVVPMVAFLGSWVLSATFFTKVPLLFLPLNIILAPLLPLYFAGALAYLALLCLGVDASWLASLLSNGYEALEGMAAWLTSIPWNVHEVRLPVPAVWLYLIAIGFFAYRLHGGGRRHWLAGASLLAVTLILIIVMPARAEADKFVVGGNYKRCTLTSMHRGNLMKGELPADSLTTLSLHGSRIIFLDCPIEGECEQRIRCRHLILGPHYEGSLRHALEYFNPEQVHYHPCVELSDVDAFEAELSSSGASSCPGVSGERRPINR